MVVKRDTGFVVIVALIVLTVALLAASVGNKGCLPWQERVGGDNASHCSGSWFPLGSALPRVSHAAE